MKKYTATTSPGTFSKLYNSKGDAHLINGDMATKKANITDDALVQAEEFTVERSEKMVCDTKLPSSKVVGSDKSSCWRIIKEISIGPQVVK